MTRSMIYEMTGASLNETGALAASLSAHIHPGDVIALEGDLGAGKTEFARAFIRAWTGNPNEEVPSPTFTLVQIYDRHSGEEELHHMDLYRIEEEGEAEELGFSEAVMTAVVLVEWPGRLGALLPRNALEIAFTIEPEGSRHIRIVGNADWAARLGDLNNPVVEGLI